jgi:hypothetical protein
MSKWQDEIYTKYKVETIIVLIAVGLIGFLWKFLPDLLPFLATTEIKLLYCIKVVLCLSLVILALGTYIFYLLKKIKKLKTPSFIEFDINEFNK